MKKIRAFLIILLMDIFVLSFTVSVYGAGWCEENGYWRYQNCDGSYISSSEFIDGKLYHFDTNGYLMTDPFESDNIYSEYLYKIYIDQNFSQNDIRIAFADLTFDGHEELIVVYFPTNGSNPYLYVYTIVQNQVTEIYCRQSSFRNPFYFCIRNNNVFLLNKMNGIYQGEGGLTYLIYYLNPDGTENIVEEYSVYLLTDTLDGMQKEDLFEQKYNAVRQGCLMIIDDEHSSLWPVNRVFMQK